MRILLKIPFAVEVGNEAVRLGKLAQIIQSNPHSPYATRKPLPLIDVTLYN